MIPDCVNPWRRHQRSLERARREGKRLGRPPASPVLLHAARDLVAAGVTVAEAARRKGVARSTLQRFLTVPLVTAATPDESGVILLRGSGTRR